MTQLAVTVVMFSHEIREQTEVINLNSYLIGITRFRNLLSSLWYNIMMVGGLNLTPNFKAFD